jgi:ABC-2 type transport system ATP-binding protein
LDPKIAIEVKNLGKVFGDVKALDEFQLQIRTGEIYGLIGPNGAGKTTALRILATLLLPTSGTATIFGLNVVDEAAEVRKHLTYLPEEAGAYKNLSGYEYLEFMTKFTILNPAVRKEVVEAAAKISGLGDRLRDKVKVYSKGMKRRLLVARTLMTRPKLAILDEPTSGLDVLHSVHVRGLIKEYVQHHGVTVLLSSHNMLEVEHLCDRVALINQGRIVAEGSPSELKTRFKVPNLEEAFAKVVSVA